MLRRNIRQHEVLIGCDDKSANPKRGDIVTFRHDEGTPEVFIKRIVGLPGDRVRVDRGVVFLNGSALSEPYVRFRDDRSFPEVTVPASWSGLSALRAGAARTVGGHRFW